jgi:hypothetical protein
MRPEKVIIRQKEKRRESDSDPKGKRIKRGIEVAFALRAKIEIKAA